MGVILGEALSATWHHFYVQNLQRERHAVGALGGEVGRALITQAIAFLSVLSVSLALIHMLKASPFHHRVHEDICTWGMFLR